VKAKAKIKEESTEISNIKESYYNVNDPDIIRLNTFTESRKAIPMEEDYIKDADEEDEELYKDFGKTEVSTDTGKVRDIHSAHPKKIKNTFVDNKHYKVPFSATQRLPGTPLETVKEKQRKVYYEERIKKVYSKNLKSIKLAKGGGFTLSGANFYTPKKNKKSNKSELPSCMIIKSQLAYTLSTFSSNRVKTAQATSPDFNRMQKGGKFLFTEGERVRQLNVLTSSVRPTTAVEVQEKPQNWLSMSQDRPMSAYILTGSFLKKYVPTAYIKPFTVRQKPISAAVNYKLSSEKDCLDKVNPEKAKTKYQRYLRKLEMEAKQFIIEEDIMVNG
jgi:hypothetical protein